MRNVFSLCLAVLCPFAAYGLMVAKRGRTESPRNSVGKHPDTIIKIRRPVFGAGNPALRPADIYWKQAINIGRIDPDTGETDSESWGNPSELIPLLAMGWNTTYNVPVMLLADMTNGAAIIAECVKQRISTLATLVQVQNKAVLDPDASRAEKSVADDYEKTYFVDKQPIAPVAYAIGGFRRASVIHSAVGEWVREDKAGIRKFQDYTVSVAVETSELSDSEILVRLIADNNRVGQRDYSSVSYCKIARALQKAAMAKNDPLVGDKFRRAVGVHADKRSIWQKVEALVALDLAKPELAIINRLTANVEKEIVNGEEKAFEYKPGAKIPFSKLPGYQAIATLAGKASEERKGGKVTGYKFPHDETAKALGLSVGVPASDNQVEQFLTMKFNTVKAEGLTDKKFDALYPQLSAGKFPGTEKPINRGPQLVEFVKAILSREPERFTAALETWDAVTVPTEGAQ